MIEPARVSLRVETSGENDREIEVVAELPSTRGAQILMRRADAIVSLVGHSERTETSLRFRPAVPLQPSSTYEVELAMDGAESQRLIYETSADTARPATHVLSIEPALERVPANLLRFYVTFSAPMEGAPGFHEHVQLFDLATDEAIEYAWREIDLWSPDRRRVTLLVHPGRVKRGIEFARDLGPVLVPGQRYELVINQALRDRSGRPLAKESRFIFEVDPADAELPDPTKWRVQPPDRSGTRDPLVVSFDEAMDGELLRTRLHPRRADGRDITGEVEIHENGRRWHFVPSTPWSQGTHEIGLSGPLEDLAGNTPTEPFDRPVGWKRTRAPVESLGFTIP